MKRLIWVLVLSSLVGACSLHRREMVPPPPNLSERLDSLYAENRLAWRQEMARLLREEGIAIPPRHLALALKYFNHRRYEQLSLEAAWRYLHAKAMAGKLSAVDRELFRAYVERVLSGNDPKGNRRLRDLCVFLEDEPVCSQK